jgi:hypothetical protein
MDNDALPPRAEAERRTVPEGWLRVKGEKQLYIKLGRFIRYQSNDLHEQIEFGRRKSASNTGRGLNPQRGGRR